MAHTHIIDIKAFPQELLNTSDRAEVREDGSRHLNLDLIFAGQLKAEPNEIDGLPATVVSVAYGARIKLAGNARQHTSRFDGRTVTLYDYFNFGGWDDQNYGRTEYQGRMVQGPHMFAYMLGTMLTAHAQPDETAFLVEEGDTLTFLGSEFRVTFPRYSNNNMTLVPVKEAVTA